LVLFSGSKKGDPSGKYISTHQMGAHFILNNLNRVNRQPHNPINIISYQLKTDTLHDINWLKSKGFIYPEELLISKQLKIIDTDGSFDPSLTRLD